MTLVEQMLPARLLVSIGIYMQSAAHLELAIWQIVMLVEGTDDTSIEELTASLEDRRVTRKLVGKLKECSSKCDVSIGIRIAALASKVSAELEGRNLAAHGAFFYDDKTATIKVAHYFARGKKASREWFEAEGVISDEMIVTALDEIDMLLREAVSIRTRLESLAAKKSKA